MDSPISRFEEIYNDKDSFDSDGKITPDAIKSIREIDFTLLNIDEISVIEKADRLPDDLALEILKRWMHKQNDVLSNIRGKLLYTGNVEVDHFKQFIEAMKCPSISCDCVVENILYQIATGGGTLKEPAELINLNDSSLGLIDYDQTKSNFRNDQIKNLFDFNPETFYIGPSLENSYVTITLPPFLKVNLTSYELRGPKKMDRNEQGGIKSWKIYGFNQSENKVLLDAVDNNNDLSSPYSSKKFVVKNNENQYFRNFQILNSGLNHQNNQSIILSGFDISGNLIIEDD